MFHDRQSVPLRRPSAHIVTATITTGHPPVERPYPTRLAWAQALGSQARTTHGAQRFLTAHIQALRTQPPLPQRGHRPCAASRLGQRDAVRQARRNDRLDRRWEEVARQDSYQKTLRAYRALPAALQTILAPRCGGDIKTWAETRVLQLEGKQVDLRDLEVGQYARADDWYVLCRQDQTISWTKTPNPGIASTAPSRMSATDALCAAE